MTAEYVIRLIIAEIIKIEDSWWVSEQNLPENRIEYANFRKLLKDISAENPELNELVKATVRQVYADRAEKLAVAICGPVQTEPEEV